MATHLTDSFLKFCCTASWLLPSSLMPSHRESRSLPSTRKTIKGFVYASLPFTRFCRTAQGKTGKKQRSVVLTSLTFANRPQTSQATPTSVARGLHRVIAPIKGAPLVQLCGLHGAGVVLKHLGGHACILSCNQPDGVGKLRSASLHPINACS